MTTRVSEVIRGWLGWCPNSHAFNVQQARAGRQVIPADVVEPDGPHPGSNPVKKSGFSDWFTAVAIIILFATLVVGGYFWWPFFVGAVLVVGLVYWYLHDVRKAV
ncbi:MAG: hypothetical protein WC391_07370 [Methanoregula sp.]|jgi:hypothetical protein